MVNVFVSIIQICNSSYDCVLSITISISFINSFDLIVVAVAEGAAHSSSDELMMNSRSLSYTYLLLGDLAN